MAERLVLALDGSTRVCSAALLRAASRQSGSARQAAGRWEVVSRRAEADARGQAKILMRLVDEMLKENDALPAGLGAVVVGIGPGTFTGVRIAVATARALGLALNIPVLGVSTLSGLAAAASALMEAAEPEMQDREVLVPVVDARRGQVFYVVYERMAVPPGGQRSAWLRSGDCAVCDRQALGGVLGCRTGSRTVVVAEDEALVEGLMPGAATLVLDVAAENLVAGQDRLAEPGELPLGGRLGPWLRLALAGPDGAAAEGSGSCLWSPLEPGKVGTPESVKPIYVRPPDADIHITKMKDPWGDGLTEA